MTDTAAFVAWYKAKFGHFHPAAQGALWFFYGFLWIPIWYMRDRARAEPTASFALPDDPTDLHITPAPAWKRLVGFWVDYLLAVGLGVAFVGSALSPSEQREVGPLLILLAVPLFSVMLLEGLFARTAGKLLTGTRVVTADGGHPGWGRAILRMFTRCIPFEPLSLRNGVMWHDTLSGTRVAANIAITSARRASTRSTSRLDRGPALATNATSMDEAAMIRELRGLCSRFAANEDAQELVDRARAIGVELDRRGGMPAMRSVHRALGPIPGARTLDMVWNGIGHWMG